MWYANNNYNNKLYLVDYENVKADGMYGVDQLGKKDCVCIFYSENASTLTFGLHEKLNQTKGKIVLQKVEVGVKNALDFQLSTYLGYLISENEGKNETYYIVSEDKGLAILTGYWAERGENVKTASDIAAAKEDQEEEKSSKAEKKELVMLCVLKFQLKIMNITGYSMELENCIKCSSTPKEGNIYFSIEQGGIFC